MSTPSQAPGAIRNLWFRWKALRLPWRKQFLVGNDLAGNTFWEFRDALQAGRWRRIVKYSNTPHYADVKISPQWHQWLRHTRPSAPTLQEQQYEVSRQESMKILAARADERWNSMPSYLDSPSKNLSQAQPSLAPKDPGGYAQQTEPEYNQGVASGVEDMGKVSEVAMEGKDGKEVDEGRFKGGTREAPRNLERKTEPPPWAGKRPAGAPSENWQPESWTPGPAARR
ncbi:hypothetical protein LTR86_006104 [Recurvomyces mirabilis]|nr:hypothetical protein LTR86_006104 [Recurvomyces mirabilis]